MKIEGYTTDKSRSDCYQSLDEFLSTPLPVEQFRGTVFDERNNITYVITPSGITDDATDLAIPLPVAVRIAAMVTACSNDLSD